MYSNIFIANFDLYIALNQSSMPIYSIKLGGFAKKHKPKECIEA